MSTRVPVAAELRVEHRLVGGVEEQMVHEPENRVGDAVVRGVEDGGRDLEHPNRGLAVRIGPRAESGGFSVGV
jgi:hypothetical protein